MLPGGVRTSIPFRTGCEAPAGAAHGRLDTNIVLKATGRRSGRPGGLYGPGTSRGLNEPLSSSSLLRNDCFLFLDRLPLPPRLSLPAAPRVGPGVYETIQQDHRDTWYFSHHPGLHWQIPCPLPRAHSHLFQKALQPDGVLFACCRQRSNDLRQFQEQGRPPLHGYGSDNHRKGGRELTY